jgi:hypothetical protein
LRRVEFIGHGVLVSLYQRPGIAIPGRYHLDSLSEVC